MFPPYPSISYPSKKYFHRPHVVFALCTSLSRESLLVGWCQEVDFACMPIIIFSSRRDDHHVFRSLTPYRKLRHIGFLLWQPLWGCLFASTMHVIDTVNYEGEACLMMMMSRTQHVSLWCPDEIGVNVMEDTWIRLLQNCNLQSSIWIWGKECVHTCDRAPPNPPKSSLDFHLKLRIWL